MATSMHVSDVAELLSEGRTHFNLSPALLVEHSIRQKDGAWLTYTRLGIEHIVEIESINVTLDLTRVYDRVVFSDPEEADL